MTFGKLLIGAGFAVLWAGAAQAELKICNDTSAVQSVSVGYKGDSDWTSEGWWNIDPGACVTPVAGDLKQRFYYYRAEIDGGDFEGQNYFFCTSPQEYTIVGDSDCEARGYDREDFYEIDTGETNKDFTLTLVADATESAPATETAELGLKICNETAFVQAVSIGYEGDEGWTSEGWWNIDPKGCATVVGGELKKRYYYYRTEVDGGPFDKGDYFFCTTPQEYTIIGDTDCEARGYDNENFAEIDTGPTAKGYTLTLVADAASDGAGKDEKPLGKPTVTETPAAAGGLRFCNETAFIQAVSIGYEGDQGWTSEGWWNVDPGACSTVIGTALAKRYYYYRAEVNGGDFTGGGYFFCTTPESYTIVGDTDCKSRGYAREDFAEIDVGAGVVDFEFTLVAGETATDVTPSAGDGGLRICNETADVQAVSIGYQAADEQWTSEGWWNLETGQCATVIAGTLQKRYYYYRAEIDGGPFDGGGYMFCTTPEEYTIVGDTDCEGRGYDFEDFAEIDTGPTATSFTFTLVSSGGAAPEPELFEEAAPEAVPEPDAVAGPETSTPKVGLEAAPGVAAPDPVSEPDPVAEPEPVPEPDPEPEPEPDPEPMVEPDPAPVTPRRGGSRGG